MLGAGGTIGAAWMSGVLAGIADGAGIDLRAVEHVVGTSAGAMVAADLLAGVEPRAPASVLDGGRPATRGQDASADQEPAGLADEEPALLAAAARLGTSAAAALGRPLAPLALALARPGGALVRAAALARIEPPRAMLDDLGARIAAHGLVFDGQLRVVCVERATGRRVVFGAPGAPPATVAQAVQASCSLPWVNGPVRIDERDYVDGGIWSPTNLDAAPALRDTHVLCLAPMAGPLGRRERHGAIRAATLSALTLETLALRRRGALVQVVVPAGAAEVGEHARVTGYRQGLALATA